MVHDDAIQEHSRTSIIAWRRRPGPLMEHSKEGSRADRETTKYTPDSANR